MKVRQLTFSESQTLLLAGGVTVLCLSAFLLLFWIQQAALLQYLYPVAALGIGFLLYVSSPPLYLGFTCWMWFLTPFVRRIVDYQAGFSFISLIMLAPFLVTALSIITLVRYGGWLRQPRYYPFALVLGGVLYGYAVGIVLSGLYGATYDLLLWLSPVLLGFHVAIHWQQYPRHRQVVRTTFMWGVLLMGSYGILQFITAPAWDTYWMVGANMGSIGKPVPFGMRVFSTLNAPGPFAVAVMVGLLLLFDGKGIVPRLAAVPGYIGFLLSLVRSAWGGWVLGVLFLVYRLRGYLQKRLVVVLGVSVVLCLPVLLTYSPVTQRVNSRAETLSNVQEDGSFKARVELYRGMSDDALLNPLGSGLGSIGKATKASEGSAQSFESGLLSIPYVLGWPGTILYLTGLVLLFVRIAKTRVPAADQFGQICDAIVIAFAALMVLGNMVVGVKGVLVWIFLALAMAARLHAQPVEAPAEASVEA